ncbi:MAG: ParB/RepB/Spo0J family partition protein [Papillibacter sp.]|jgi:ParB family chromosome partitioning protein|nr:ParB/RepB/Spo0J family partition protein [Papillibacter sp.]
MKTPSLYDSKKILNIPVTDISPNPNQPRKQFDKETLNELADSILRYGVLQPITVRKSHTGYELVAGERRLRAAKLAGLTTIPCISLDVDAVDSGLIALVENLQRRDLDFIEEAEGLATLIKAYGLSQEEAARRVSKSQSAVANKLRLLKLSPEILYILRENKLTERHARALLRVEKEEDRLNVLKYIIENGLNVAKSEEYIERLLKQKPLSQTPPKAQAKKSPFFAIKDVRIFLNTVSRGLGMMKSSGIAASCQQSETENDLILTITIPKSRA